jgi:hypothetical protein
METRTFKSTNVEEASYDPVKSRLIVTFGEGRQYQYDRVPPKVWEKFKESGSAGRFVNEELQHYSFRRM